MNSHFGELIADKTKSSDEKKKEVGVFTTVGKLVYVGSFQSQQRRMGVKKYVLSARRPFGVPAKEVTPRGLVFFG